ncbi:Protein kinase of the Mitotic Exit Network [Coemansia spiralis]|uniref:Protein kinase of the Mitotic Exit Network n=1 Tax=Coemansia spiralis TaxID=417178 RepID=A0A9W8GKN2_9FUNG|nr:Protein kinase of the Mitotic Exit Network [Coemansia spiralis]
MDDVRRIGEYQLGDIIGKGAAGSVYRGLNLRTGGVVAIKQIRKEGFSSNDEIEAARKEIDVLRDLHHRNIVKYIGYEQTEQELDIILEYCEGGSLQNILRKFSKFPENLVGVYVAQILDGLSYLHSNAILHRDIKPGNILLVKEGVVKLADFGVARIQNGLDTVVGSPYWIAPEVLQLKGATSASDIWSLGCTIVQLVDGKAPYQDLPPMAAMFRIGQDEHPPFPSNISPQLRDFLSRCLVHVPSARASADELRQHEWIRACLREREREGQPQDTYERDIRTVAQWNQVLQNSSPRDVKRFSIGNNGSHAASGNHVSSYSSTRTRDEIPGAIAGMSSMGISNSNDSTTRRTVSSIAAYEEDSGDDWDNAFENLDALQLKPRTHASLAYPQSIAPPGSPAVGPRNHSLSVASDAVDTESGAYVPVSNERTVSDPAANGHSGMNMPARVHTSPPSPRMRPLKKHAISPPEFRHVENSAGYEDDRSASSNENVYFDNMDYSDGARISGSSVYFASATDVRMEAMGDPGSKRPALGLRQDIAHSSSTQMVPVARSFHQRDMSQVSLETPNASSDQLPGLAYQQSQGPQQRPQLQNKAKQTFLRHTRGQESRELFLPGFPSKASEERLRRETEIRWVQDVGTIMAHLREVDQEDVLIYHCQQIVNLLRDGRGVFAASRDWRVRSIIDAIRLHLANANALKHLLSLVNRLCHTDARYLRTFCLHGVLPLILPILQRQQPAAAHDLPAHELQSEVISYVNRLCRSEDVAPVHMLLACDGISALCVAVGALAELDVAVAAAQLSRVLTSLISLLISKALPAELSAADIGDLLLHAQIAPVLSSLLVKYGEACLSPPSSGHASANGSDLGGHSQPSAADRVYHGVCDVLMVVSRLFNELVRRVEALQDHICESGLLGSMFMYLQRYPRKAVVLVIHGVRYLSKNPMSLDVLDKAGIFSVSAALLSSASAHAYREYVMTTVLRLCSSSLERQNKMAAMYPAIVSAAMEFAQLKEAPTLSKCGRLIVLGLSNGGPQCCRVLKEVDAFELVVKLISRERWCGMAIRALLEWTRTVPADIVPSLTGEHAAAGWAELARPLLSLSTSSTTLDIYAATFYSLVRLYVPSFPRACMGPGDASGECIWVMLMDRYLNCSGLGNRDHPAIRQTPAAMESNGMSARPEVVAANRMNATTRLTFLNLLLLLQPHLRLATTEMRRRIAHYYTEMVISSKLDAALPVRKASLELSLALERM